MPRRGSDPGVAAHALEDGPRSRLTLRRRRWRLASARRGPRCRYVACFCSACSRSPWRLRRPRRLRCHGAGAQRPRHVTQRTLSCLPPPTGCTATTTNFSLSASRCAAVLAVLGDGQRRALHDSFATQDSTISASSLVAQGNSTHSGSATLTTPPNVYTTISSYARDAASRRASTSTSDADRLVGQRASIGEPERERDDAHHAEDLGRRDARRSGGRDRSGLSGPRLREVGPLPAREFGVLAPGSYVLEAKRAAPRAVRFANSFLALVTTWDYACGSTRSRCPALSPAGSRCSRRCRARGRPRARGAARAAGRPRSTSRSTASRRRRRGRARGARRRPGARRRGRAPGSRPRRSAACRRRRSDSRRARRPTC